MLLDDPVVCWGRGAQLFSCFLMCFVFMDNVHEDKDFGFSREQLAWLDRSVVPRIELDADRRPFLRWLSPSLVGSLAMMAVTA